MSGRDPSAPLPPPAVRSVEEARPAPDLVRDAVADCRPDPVAFAHDGRGRRAERLIALALFAGVLFNPPLMRVFGRSDTLFGLPLMYLYVFVAWAGIILIAARLSDGPGRD